MKVDTIELRKVIIAWKNKEIASTECEEIGAHYSSEKQEQKIEDIQKFALEMLGCVSKLTDFVFNDLTGDEFKQCVVD